MIGAVELEGGSPVPREGCDVDPSGASISASSAQPECRDLRIFAGDGNASSKSSSKGLPSSRCSHTVSGRPAGSAAEADELAASPVNPLCSP